MKVAWVLFFVMLFLHACIVTAVEPFYEQTQAIMVPTVIGSWKDKDGHIYTIKKNIDSSYSMVVKNESSTLLMHFFSLGKDTFLDLFPENTTNKFGIWTAHLLPLHSISKVHLKQNTWNQDLSSPDSLNYRLKACTLNLAHVRTREGNLVITASTKDLQDFLKSNQDSTWLFDASSNVCLTRFNPTTSKKKNKKAAHVHKH